MVPACAWAWTHRPGQRWVSLADHGCSSHPHSLHSPPQASTGRVQMETHSSHVLTLNVKLTDIENRLMVAKGKREVREGWIGSLRLADAIIYIE